MVEVTRKQLMKLPNDWLHEIIRESINKINYLEVINHNKNEKNINLLNNNQEISKEDLNKKIITTITETTNQYIVSKNYNPKDYIRDLMTSISIPDNKSTVQILY